MKRPSTTTIEKIEFPDRVKGKPDIRSWRNIAALLKHHDIEIMRNDFSNRDEIDGGLLTDDDVTRLLDIAHRSDLRCSREFLYERLRATALANRYHPVREWLAELEWDGKGRLDGWLVTYMGADDTPLNRAVGRLTLIAAVRRVMKPGTKFDTMLVLEGSQGVGKSSAIATLLPDVEWFSDNFSLTHDSKRIIEQTRGKMIIEVPELKGMRRSEIDHVKAMLSRTHDEARLAYGRETTAAARQFIMIGTVNSDSKGEARYLKDDTGNRRFWPVLVDEIDLPALRRDRRQLWAEAYARRKESLVLDRELWTSSEREQKQRMEQSFDHTFVANYVSELKSDQVVMQEDIWEHLKKPLANVTQPLKNELGRVLKNLGYSPKKFRKNGNSYWGYARSERSK